MATFVIGSMVWRAFVTLSESRTGVARHGCGYASHGFIVRGCLLGIFFKLFLCVCHDLLPFMFYVFSLFV
jgi:hypothetical protein